MKKIFPDKQLNLEDEKREREREKTQNDRHTVWIKQIRNLHIVILWFYILKGASMVLPRIRQRSGIATDFFSLIFLSKFIFFFSHIVRNKGNISEWDNGSMLYEYSIQIEAPVKGHFITKYIGYCCSSNIKVCESDAVSTSYLSHWCKIWTQNDFE